ncbi:MAG TPA: signal peptide peptidase SppA [Polyangiaceae bacterium]|nr:signal peptide peptidase SppA [Polyangiaceae bacterium]
MRTSLRIVTSLAALPLVFASTLSHAQTPMQRPTQLPALGRNLVSNSDSTTIVQNPANLVLLPGPELRWTGYFLGDDAQVPSEGHAFGLAFPLGFLPISTGLRLDLGLPSALTGRQMYGIPFQYQWLTWAIAAGNRVASIGVSFERSFSDIPQAHGFGTWSTGLSLRPVEYAGIAGVIHQVDAPTSQAGNRLGTSYEMGLTLRPLGNDGLELAGETAYIDDPGGGYWVPRGVVDIGIPGLGRIRGDVAFKDPGGDVGDPSWVASTALVLTTNGRSASAELGVGTRYGNGLGSAAGEKPYENIHVDLAVRGFRETFATETSGYGLRVRLEETPDVRGHVRLLRRLWQMAEEENSLKAVLLELRASPANSMAHLEELQDALHYLRARGKKVLCHLEDGDAASLHLCAAADRILLNPAGSVRFAGLKIQSFYIQGLLDKLGIQADFVRIGKHKSAPETFVRNEGTPTALDDRADLLQQVERELTHSLSVGRHLSPEAVRKAAADGPFTAAEAKRAELIDGFAFDDMLDFKLSELAGESLFVEDGPFGPSKSNYFGPEGRLAIVYVDGDMVDGRSQSFPFIGLQTAGSYTIAESLKQVRDDPSVGAVVLRIETGGGSAMAADVIWREVQLTAAKKPVIVSMGTAAASGGYYIASPGTYVYANPLTITGSIGIFFGKIDVAGLLGKIGVNVETVKTTPRADAEGIFRPFSDDERDVLKGKIEQFYALFVRRVADGRHLPRDQVDAVGRGRVWTGRQAQERKLVDELGGLRQAMAKARVLGRLRDDAPILELPVPRTSILGYLLGMEGVKEQLGTAMPPLPRELLQLVQAIAPYAVHSPDQPLARLESMPRFLP